MLEKRTTLDRIEIVPATKSIQIRQKMSIVEIAEQDSNEIELSFLYHRYVLNPGDDLSNEDLSVQAIATTVWTDVEE